MPPNFNKMKFSKINAAKRNKFDLYCNRYQVGYVAYHYGIQYAQMSFPLMKRQTIYYWKKQYMRDSTKEMRVHGGRRNSKFNILYDLLIEQVIRKIVDNNSTLTLQEIKQQLMAFNVHVSRAYISCKFKTWGWSFKKIYRKNHLKFTYANLGYYAQYLVYVKGIPWHHLKNLDETHCENKMLYRQFGIAPKGKTVQAI